MSTRTLNSKKGDVIGAKSSETNTWYATVSSSRQGSQCLTGREYVRCFLCGACTARLQLPWGSPSPPRTPSAPGGRPGPRRPLPGLLGGRGSACGPGAFSGPRCPRHSAPPEAGTTSASRLWRSGGTGAKNPSVGPRQVH
jgi:hypothetical protein